MLTFNNYLFYLYFCSTELFIIIEIDNYGHFFQKANTKVLRGSHELHFNQDFTLDLDGSSTLRCILYEEIPSQTKPLLRGKVTLELGRSWLKDRYITKELIFSDVWNHFRNFYLSEDQQIS